MKRKLLFIGLGVAAALGLLRWQLARWFTDKPDYTIERRVGSVEIRRYSPLVVAETTAESGSWKDALYTGFRRLFDFISGGNRARERLEMTAPVTQRSERISMTAPVTAERGEPGRYRVSFIMPPGRSLSSLPVPADDRVILREVPSRRIAALRYSGGHSEERMQKKAKELRSELLRAGLSPRGEVVFAGYDPPTTLPFLRRNEVWLELAPESSQEAP